MEKKVKDEMSAGELAERIVELEDSNRRLTAALKRGENAEPMRVEMDLTPVFDSRSELENLSGILGAILYVMGGPDEVGEREDLQTLFADIQETVANCAEALNGAIKEMKIVDRSGATKSAAAVDPDQNIVSRLARCREIYDSFKDSERPEDVLRIDLRLNELTSFIHNAALPAIGLKEDFMALRNSIITKQKSAPAAVAAAAGA